MLTQATAKSSGVRSVLVKGHITGALKVRGDPVWVTNVDLVPATGKHVYAEGESDSIATYYAVSDKYNKVYAASQADVQLKHTLEALHDRGECWPIQGPVTATLMVDGVPVGESVESPNFYSAPLFVERNGGFTAAQ